MLNDEICKLREKLNKSIEQGDDYSVTYQLSVELDELIAHYYDSLKKIGVDITVPLTIEIPCPKCKMIEVYEWLLGNRKKPDFVYC